MNLANKLTISRMIIVFSILVIYLADFFTEYSDKIALVLVLFIVGAITDFLDGYYARKRNEVTTIGKFLDPIADKLLVTICLIIISMSNEIDNTFILIVIFTVITRDMLVGGIRQLAASTGKVVSANKWGKYKTIVTDIAIAVSLFFIYYVNVATLPVYLEELQNLTYALLFIAANLTIISGTIYLKQNRSLFKDTKD